MVVVHSSVARRRALRIDARAGGQSSLIVPDKTTSAARAVEMNINYYNRDVPSPPFTHNCTKYESITNVLIDRIEPTARDRVDFGRFAEYDFMLRRL